TRHVISKCRSGRRKPFPQHCLTHQKKLCRHKSTAWWFEPRQPSLKCRDHTPDQWDLSYRRSTQKTLGLSMFRSAMMREVQRGLTYRCSEESARSKKTWNLAPKSRLRFLTFT